MGVSTSSSLTLCIVTKAVYRTSLSRQTITNVSKQVTQPSLLSKRSSTSGNLQQQMHSTAHGIVRHFMQEHQEVLPSLSVKLTWQLVSLLSLSLLVLQRLLVQIYIVISCRYQSSRYSLPYLIMYHIHKHATSKPDASL